MKLTFKIIVFTFLSFSTLIFAQGVTNDIKISKKSIEKIFKNSIYQPKNKITIPSNPWFSDNSKYNADTIQIINSNIGVNPSICNVKNWTFYRKNSLIITTGSYCKEPPTESSTKLTDYFDVKIYEEDNQTFLELYNQKKLDEKFVVINIQQYNSLSYINEKKYTITLQRIEKNACR